MDLQEWKDYTTKYCGHTFFLQTSNYSLIHEHQKSKEHHMLYQNKKTGEFYTNKYPIPMMNSCKERFEINDWKITDFHYLCENRRSGLKVLCSRGDEGFYVSISTTNFHPDELYLEFYGVKLNENVHGWEVVAFEQNQEICSSGAQLVSFVEEWARDESEWRLPLLTGTMMLVHGKNAFALLEKYTNKETA